MSQQQSIQPKMAVNSLERLACSIESPLSTKPWLSISLLSVAFVVCVSVEACRRPLWFDELITDYIVALPSFGAIWKAVSAGADQTPPLFHLTSKLSSVLFGLTPLGLRFPAIAGYLTMMLCIYFAVKRYAGPLYASIGALSSYLTGGPGYGVAARPYGLILGLSSIALVCWQKASRYQVRHLALAGLCLSLATALSLHYYALLAFAAIGFGELVRTWRTRRLDWPIWTALALATTPLLFLLPLIRANWFIREGFYSPATLSNFFRGTMSIYLTENGVPFAASAWAAFVAIAGICVMVFGRQPARPHTRFETPPLYELAAWVALLFAPLDAFLAGRLVTGMFVHRYALVTIIGFSLLLPLCLHRLFQSSRAAALSTLVVLVLCFGGHTVGGSKKENASARLAPWLRKAGMLGLPVVVADPITYLPLAHYVPKELADRLVYIPDGKEAFRYIGASTPDYNVAGLRGIAQLNLPTYSGFLHSHRRFLVIWEVETFGWIVYKLRQTGAELRLCDTLGRYMLFLVDVDQDASARIQHVPDETGAARLRSKASVPDFSMVVSQ